MFREQSVALEGWVVAGANVGMDQFPGMLLGLVPPRQKTSG